MNKKQPLFHASKRKEITVLESIAIKAFAILLALIVCGVITALLTGLDPVQVYAAMFQGALGTSRKTWATLQNTAMLLCVSLAVTPAFMMKFWNVGAEGQTLMGCLGTATIMILFGDKWPSAVLYPVEIIVGILAGAIWALIPAICKAKWNTNETLSTLMMNYIAKQIAAYFVVLWENPRGSGNIGVINSNTNAGWFPTIFGQKFFVNIIVVLLLTIIIAIYINCTKQGYEISVVGESERTARYIGIKVGKVIIRTVLISGAICGIAGVLLVAGTNHTLTSTLVAGRGFTAVMVSWMSGFKPAVMALTSFFITFLEQGAGQITTTFGLNQSFSDILTGIIIFFIIGSDFFTNYKLNFRKKEEKQ